MERDSNGKRCTFVVKLSINICTPHGTPLVLETDGICVSMARKMFKLKVVKQSFSNSCLWPAKFKCKVLIYVRGIL